jgi:hypothetical protein
MRLPIPIIALFLSVSLLSFAQENCENIRFQKIFKVGPPSGSSALISTRDGGYLLTGGQNELLEGNGDGLLMKLNKFGEPGWLKAYNRAEGDFTFANSAQLVDGGFITIANLHDGGSTLQKTSESGNLVWQKKLSNEIGPITPYQVISDEDGGFTISGVLVQSTFEGSSIVIKFDVNGNQVWKKFWNNGNHVNYAYTLLRKEDTLIVSGFIPALDPAAADTVYITKISATDGEIFTSKSFWNGNNKLGSNLVMRTDNSYLLLSTSYDENGVVQTILTHLDQGLNEIQSVSLNIVLTSSVTTMAATNDNGAVITIYDPIENKNYLAKLNTDLSFAFVKLYEQNLPEYSIGPLVSLIQTSDNGFLVGTTVVNNSENHIFLLKTDAAGKTSTCKTQSVSFSTGTASLSSSFFSWNTGEINAIINEEDISIPDNTLTAIVQTYCFSTSCSPDCDLTCSITSKPTNNTFTGGDPNIIYIGYGPQSTTLSAATNSTGALTYSWTGNGQLSCYNCASPVFAPTTPGTYTFTVTIQDESGCSSTCTISICVSDIRITIDNDKKVFLCHIPPGNTGNPQQLTVSINAVSEHLLNHPGDKLGICGQPCGSPLPLYATNSGKYSNSTIPENKININIYPNPVKDHIYVRLNNEVVGEYIIKIVSADGRVVSTGKYQGMINNIKIDSQLTPGIYIMEISFENRKEIFKFIKEK